MWSGPCQQLALATVLDAPHGPRPTHEHVRKTSPVHLPCICRYRHLSHLCTVGIAHRVRARTVVESYRGARGAAIARWTREIYRPRYGYLSRYAVASTRRVAERSYACGRGGGRAEVGARWARKYAYFHTQKSEPQPATAHRLPALVGTLSSAKSEELRARAITNLPKSSEYRRAGTGMWERVGRPVPVF